MTVFIALGLLHLKFAMFSVTDMYIAEPLGLYVLIESFVLAKGSTNFFFKKRMYKPYSKLHELFPV